MTCRVLIIAIVVVAVAVTPLMVFAASVPFVGSLAPEFTLTLQEGTLVSRKDYRGKWVILYFYPRDFTIS
jgi:peroxiredoxin Q/BCP